MFEMLDHLLPSWIQRHWSTFFKVILAFKRSVSVILLNFTDIWCQSVWHFRSLHHFLCTSNFYNLGGGRWVVSLLGYPYFDRKIKCCLSISELFYRGSIDYCPINSYSICGSKTTCCSSLLKEERDQWYMPYNNPHAMRSYRKSWPPYCSSQRYS